MESAAINHYRRMTTTAKVPTTPGIDQCPATNLSISSELYLLGVKFQLVIWSVLNNRFDELIGPALELFKVVLQRRTEKTRRNQRC